MAMEVMHVGRVRMSMRQWPMLMRVSMGLARRVFRAVLMLVVLVVDMRVGVLCRFVNVLMLVTFRHVEPYP